MRFSIRNIDGITIAKTLLTEKKLSTDRLADQGRTTVISRRVRKSKTDSVQLAGTGNSGSRAGLRYAHVPAPGNHGH